MVFILTSIIILKSGVTSGSPPVAVISGVESVALPVNTNDGKVTAPVAMTPGVESVALPVNTNDGKVIAPVAMTPGVESVALPVNTNDGKVTAPVAVISGAVGTKTAPAVQNVEGLDWLSDIVAPLL